MSAKTKTFVWLPARVQSDFWATSTPATIYLRDLVLDVEDASWFDVEVRVFLRYDSTRSKMTSLNLELESAVTNADAAFSSTAISLDIKDDAQAKGTGNMPYFARSRVDVGADGYRYWRCKISGLSTYDVTTLIGYEVSVTLYGR